MKTVFLLCLIASSMAVPRPEKRIVKGSQAALFAHPHQVSIQYRYNDGSWNHMCGGSLLNDRTVLTAAHCLKGIDKSRLRCVVGELDFDDNSNTYKQTIEISTTVMHEGFTGTFPGLHDDIGIIILTEPVTLNQNVQFASLASDDSAFVDTHCTISGWGLTSRSPDILPRHLQEVQITVISTPDCQSKQSGITDKHVCVFENSAPPGSRQSACVGDSGGPLMCGGNVSVLAGITSWGQTTCSGNKPAVYTRVTSYLDWIAEHTA